MREAELHKLNKTIMKIDGELLNKVESLVESKKALEKARQDMLNNLDPKLPEFSNETKRKRFVDSSADIAAMELAVSAQQHNIAYEEIEQRYRQRRFDILMKYGGTQ